MKEFITALMSAPDSQLDASMKLKIQPWWEKEPTALQILEVLDQCVYEALCSDFMIRVFQTLYAAACKKENTTHEEVVKGATWRNEI